MSSVAAPLYFNDKAKQDWIENTQQGLIAASNLVATVLNRELSILAEVDLENQEESNSELSIQYPIVGVALHRDNQSTALLQREDSSLIGPSTVLKFKNIDSRGVNWEVEIHEPGLAGLVNESVRKSENPTMEFSTLNFSIISPQNSENENKLEGGSQGFSVKTDPETEVTGSFNVPVDGTEGILFEASVKKSGLLAARENTFFVLLAVVSMSLSWIVISMLRRHSRSSLRNKERLAIYQAMEQEPDIVFIFDYRRRLKYINRSGRNLFEVSEDNIPPGDVLNYLGLDDLQKAEIKKDLRHRGSWTGHLTINDPKSKNGTPFSIRVNQINGGKSDQVFYWGIARDRSAELENEKTLQKSEEALQAIEINSHEGIAQIGFVEPIDVKDSIDAQVFKMVETGKISSANSKFYTLLGLFKGDVPGQSNELLKDLVYDPDNFLKPIFSKFSKNLNLRSFEIELETRSGQTKKVEIRCIGLFNGARTQLTDVMITILDLSKRVLLEEKNRRLETDLLELQSRRLACNVTHHFNNQLTVLRGQIKEALCNGELDTDSRVQLNGALKEVTKLQDKTQVYSILSGDHLFIKDTVVPEEVVEGLLAEFPDDFRIDSMLPTINTKISCDRSALQLLLRTLIESACEHCSKNNGTVRVSIAQYSPDTRPVGSLLRNVDFGSQNVLSLRVIDSGCGISGSVPDKFLPFKNKADNSHGIELATSIPICEFHGWDIHWGNFSGVHSGTVMEILIPLECSDVSGNEDRYEPKENLELESIDLEDLSILVVDDNDGVRDVTVMQLESVGIKTYGAESGETAVTKFGNMISSLDVVVIDMSMPGWDGIDTYRELKKFKPDLPVIFMSGHTQKQMPDMEKESDSWAYLPKPFDKEVLIEKIYVVLRRINPNTDQSDDENAGGVLAKLTA